MNNISLTIIDVHSPNYNKGLTVLAPFDAEHFVLDYYAKYRVIPLNEHIQYVSMIAKQGAKVRLK